LKGGSFFIDSRNSDVFYTSYLDYCAEREPEYSRELKKIEGVIGSNFYVYWKYPVYAADGEKVYFNRQYIGEDMGCSEKWTLAVLQDADPNTFEPKIVTNFNISQGNSFQALYAKDEDTVWYDGQVLEGVDAGTFEVTDTVRITKDKNNVYLSNVIIPGADPETFIVKMDVHRGEIYATDKNNLFISFCAVSGVDLNTFEFVKYGGADNEYKDTLRDKDGEFQVFRDEYNSCRVAR